MDVEVVVVTTEDVAAAAADEVEAVAAAVEVAETAKFSPPSVEVLDVEEDDGVAVDEETTSEEDELLTALDEIDDEDGVVEFDALTRQVFPPLLIILLSSLFTSLSTRRGETVLIRSASRAWCRRVEMESKG